MEKENGKESKRERKRKRERERERNGEPFMGTGVGGRNNYLFVLCTGKGEAVWQVMWALLWMWV